MVKLSISLTFLKEKVFTSLKIIFIECKVTDCSLSKAGLQLCPGPVSLIDWDPTKETLRDGRTPRDGASNSEILLYENYLEVPDKQQVVNYHAAQQESVGLE